VKIRHVYSLFVVLTSASALCSVISGRHLLYDGAYFFVRIIERASFAAQDTFRTAHHILIHGPFVLAVRLGVTDWSLLSLLFGSCVFGMPLALVVWATCWLFRAGQPGLGLMMIVTYALAMNFTGLFMISESHLAMATFFLALSALRCGDLLKLRSAALLFAIGIVAMLCYEFWAIFALGVLALLLLRTVRERLDLRRTPALVGVFALYTGVFVSNAIAIATSTHAPNRDAMLVTTLSNLRYVLTALLACAGVGVLVLWRAPALADVASHSERGTTAKIRYAWWLIVSSSGLVGWLGFSEIAPVSAAYALRTLNCLLPMVFAVVLISSILRDTAAPPKYLAAFASCLVTMVVGAQLRHTVEWSRFTDSVLADLEQGRGYLSSEALPSMREPYAGSWTNPALSIALQGVRDHSLRSVIYNPRATWQPFGPPDCASPKAFAIRYGIDTDSLISKNSPECRQAAPSSDVTP
jgi:hypothetical protein